MRRIAFIVVLLAGCGNAPALESRLRDGDIIFHESRSAQSQAIQLATRSSYSHMGILYQRNGSWFVYEAVQPVKLTPLDVWIARGKHGHFVVKRLRNVDVLTAEVLRKMRAAGRRYDGKPYDLYFEWDDQRIYCSELVWKIYKQGAGIELSKLERLREFDLTHPIVRAKMKERYGKRIPLNEPVVSPAAIFDSDELVEVLRR